MQAMIAPPFPTGTFANWPVVTWRGPLDYVLDGGSYSFQRSNGQLVTPGTFRTDGGTIPRFLWGVRYFDPWSFFPAYVLHDWGYWLHGAKSPQAPTFEENNLILAEACQTLVQMGVISPKQWEIEAIYLAVTAARRLWDSQ